MVCWFSRMKTAELYLHDASLLADVLPLLLLAPQVERRAAPQQHVFEVKCPKAAQVLEEPGPAEVPHGATSSEAPVRRRWNSRASETEKWLEPPKQQKPRDSWGDEEAMAEEDGVAESVKTESAEEVVMFGEGGSSGSRPPRSSGAQPLLLQVSDTEVATSLWDLRALLLELVDLIIGDPPFQLPAEVGLAFKSLRGLLTKSYHIHHEDPSSCVTLNDGANGREALEDEDEDDDGMSSNSGGGGSRSWRGQRSSGGRGGSGGSQWGSDGGWSAGSWGGGGKGGKGRGKGKGSGYPWWQHIKPRR